MESDMAMVYGPMATRATEATILMTRGMDKAFTNGAATVIIKVSF